MSIKYMETYLISGKIYGIERIGEGFQVWADGCAIGSWSALDVAKDMLHHYVMNQTRAECRSYQERAEESQRTLVRLGADTFNLAKFAVFRKESK